MKRREIKVENSPAAAEWKNSYNGAGELAQSGHPFGR